MLVTFRAHIEGDARIGGARPSVSQSLRIATSSPPCHRCHRTRQCGQFLCVTFAKKEAERSVVPALFWLVESVTLGNDHITH
jgi:hypothetical protein